MLRKRVGRLLRLFLLIRYNSLTPVHAYYEWRRKGDIPIGDGGDLFGGSGTLRQISLSSRFLPIVHAPRAQTSAFGENAEDLMSLLQLSKRQAEAHSLVHLILAALAVVAHHCVYLCASRS